MWNNTIRCMICWLCVSFSAYSAQHLTQRQDVRVFIDQMVKKHHFSKTYLMQVFDAAEVQADIIAAMEKPYEKKTWDAYQALFLTPQRLQAGIAYWRQHERVLREAEKRYGVDASIIVAIIGVETLYGTRQGQYRVLDALSTLAFAYPKRAAYFKRELAEFLILCREHHVAPTVYKGSYAGAMGIPQFMPASYRHYAASLAHHDKKDLMQDHAHAIASVANYFHQHGWKMHEPVAVPAHISGNAYRYIRLDNRQARYSLKQLAQAGVRPAQSLHPIPKRAGLIALERDRGIAYWLVFPDFYVITRYNTSPLYAMAVYLLAQQLQHAMNPTV